MCIYIYIYIIYPSCPYISAGVRVASSKTHAPLLAGGARQGAETETELAETRDWRRSQSSGVDQWVCYNGHNDEFISRNTPHKTTHNSETRRSADTRLYRVCVCPVWVPCVGPLCVGPLCGSPVWIPCVGPLCVGPLCGSPVWVPRPVALRHVASTRVMSPARSHARVKGLTLTLTRSLERNEYRVNVNV